MNTNTVPRLALPALAQPKVLQLSQPRSFYASTGSSLSNETNQTSIEAKLKKLRLIEFWSFCYVFKFRRKKHQQIQQFHQKYQHFYQNVGIFIRIVDIFITNIIFFTHFHIFKNHQNDQLLRISGRYFSENFVPMEKYRNRRNGVSYEKE